MTAEACDHRIAEIRSGASCACGRYNLLQHGGERMWIIAEPPVTFTWRSWTPPAPSITCAVDDHVDALLDLARSGREQDFRELAAMVGIRREEHDALWEGTLRRISRS